MRKKHGSGLTFGGVKKKNEPASSWEIEKKAGGERGKERDADEEARFIVTKEKVLDQPTETPVDLTQGQD